MSERIRITCCTAEDAWALVTEIASVAIEGDDDFCRVLPAAIEHALLMEQAEIQ